jgi:hypothetical protein
MQWLAPVLAATLLFLPADVRAQKVLVSGNSFDDSNPAFTGPLATLGYDYSFVGADSFGAANLAGFSAVWLDGFSQYSPGTPGNPGLVAATLTSFMNGGGVVLVQNPGFGSESLANYPFGNELSATFNYPPGENTIRIIAPASPVNAFLTGAGLSSWTPASAFGVFVSGTGSFTGITDNGTAGNWITLTRPVGAGALIYTQQGISQSLINDADDVAALRFLDNVVGLAAIPEPNPSLLLLAGMAGLFVWKRSRSR